MLKKFTPLLFSMLICLTLLPNQAAAMGTSRNEQPIQMENLGSSNNTDAGISPCRDTIYDTSDGGVGGGIGAGDSYGNGAPVGKGPCTP